MAKSNYYAVRRGKMTGIFNTWEECRSVVEGYSISEYRGFKSLQEAQAYLRGEVVSDKRGNGRQIIIKRPEVESACNLYVNGSYRCGCVSFGIFLESCLGDFQFYGSVKCGKYTQIANIASELLSVLVGVQLSRELGFLGINIIYNYNGIESWYTGVWRANGELQKAYINLMKRFEENFGLSYTFSQVYGHTGVRGNTIADKLSVRGRNMKEFVELSKILGGVLRVEDVPRTNLVYE